MANSSNLEGGYIEITADKIEINKGSSLQAKVMQMEEKY